MLKLLYNTLGIIFVILGFVGILIPLLPTTPFLLLAATCFAKSSPRCQQWLLSNRVLGPVIKSWVENGCVSSPAKIVALSSVFFCGGGSIFFTIHNPILQSAGILVILVSSTVILRLKTCPSQQKSET